MRKTFLFLDTVYNKVDTKGRVSLPADYRSIVKELNSEIVCYRSLSAPCIEGCVEDLLEKLASEIETSTDFFSQTQDDLTNLIFMLKYGKCKGWCNLCPYFSILH